MKKTIIASCTSIILSVPALAQYDSLYYHDSVMESQWGSSTSNDQFGCFVRFTPPVYPAKLTAIRAWFRNAGFNSVIRFKVYTDAGGSVLGGVAPVYTSSVGIPNPAAGGNPNTDYTAYVDVSSNNIMIYSGDVYAGVVQSSDFFGVGIDNAPNNAVAPDRQWQWMTAFGTDYWNTLSSQASSGQFGITAFFNPFATGTPENNDAVSEIYFDNSTGMLKINSLSDHIGKLMVCDLTGRNLFEKNIVENSASVNLDCLKNGLYIAAVNENGRSHFCKFVK